MATIEQEPQQQPEFQVVPDQFDESVTERLAEQGITTTQTQPKKLTDDKGQTMVQTISDPSDDDLAAGIVIPFGEDEAEIRAKGSDKDSSTWLAVLVKKFIKIAQHTHRKIFIRK